LGQELGKRTFTAHAGRKVDFVSAPGVCADGVHRTGGPIAPIAASSASARCASVSGWRAYPGFDFDQPDEVAVTAPPSLETPAPMRGTVASQLAEIDPPFAAEAFGAAARPA